MRRPSGGRRRLNYGPAAGGRGGHKIRLIIAVGIALFSLCSYYGSKEYNPVTGENQYLSLTPRQEIALGLQSAPAMIRQHGGLYPDPKHQDFVDQVGHSLVQSSEARDTGWQFEFHLLNDPQTINAFALPGGQVFITTALYSQLKTEGQLAGVLGHEIAHVVARHSAQQMAKQQLTQGLTQAAIVGSGEASAAQVAIVAAQLINMKFGRDDELQSDKLGVEFMSDAGYDPRGMIEVMKVLAGSRSGNTPPEFFSTHPNPENRIARIQEAIEEQFPGGVPSGLKP